MIAWVHDFRKWCWLTFSVGLVAAGWGLLSHGGSRLLVGAGLAAMIGVAALIEARRWRYRHRRASPCGRKSPERAISRPRASAAAAGERGTSSPDRVSLRPGDEQADTGEEVPASSATSSPASSSECHIQEFVDTLMRAGRYALLLRPQIAGGLSPSLLVLARQRLEQQMTLVTEGDVLVEPHLVAEEPISDAEFAAARGTVVRIEATYLDRCPVTNRQYQVFLNAGGYDQMTLWDAAIWPAVVDFIDATGHPGPRYWQHGRFPPGKADHPVVGVSWYEAAAYARWIGKRLPTDAEWLKAGCWPVQPSPKSRVQRRFPWGNAMDRSRANLWGSGPGDTTVVDDFGTGASVGGISQMIGNVWEWTAEDFELPSPPKSRRDTSRRPPVAPAANGSAVNSAASTAAAQNTSPSNSATASATLAITPPANDSASAARPPLKTLRGGAFDTYFDHHAACQFASADSPLARKYNIGFRLAIGVCDLVAISDEEKESAAEMGVISPAETEDKLQPA